MIANESRPEAAIDDLAGRLITSDSTSEPAELCDYCPEGLVVLGRILGSSSGGELCATTL